MKKRNKIQQVLIFLKVVIEERKEGYLNPTYYLNRYNPLAWLLVFVFCFLSAWIEFFKGFYDTWTESWSR